jgi:hypothetical protein
MGIEVTSRESAKNFFHGLLLGMGFDEVVVLFRESERPQSLRESPNPVIR